MALLALDVLPIQLALPELFGQAVDLLFEPAQVRFVGETDDLVDAFGAIRTTLTGFDLPIRLDLPGGVGVVDMFDAQRVKPPGCGLLAQPSQEWRILAEPQFSGQSVVALAVLPVFLGAAFIVDIVDINELPSAAEHG